MTTVRRQQNGANIQLLWQPQKKFQKYSVSTK